MCWTGECLSLDLFPINSSDSGRPVLRRLLLHFYYQLSFTGQMIFYHPSMAEMILKGRKTASHPIMCTFRYTYTLVYLLVQIYSIPYDSSRYLCEQRLARARHLLEQLGVEGSSVLRSSKPHVSFHWDSC